MQVLTFPDAPEWVQEVQLEGRSYRVRARWNTSSAMWTLDMLTRDRTLVVAGVRVVRGAGMLSQFQDPRMPPGDLIAYDTGGTSTDDYLAFTEGRAAIAYLSSAELAELANA